MSSICSKIDECFDGLKLVIRTGLEPARVMKDEVGVGSEDQLIIDIVIATLRKDQRSPFATRYRKERDQAHFRSRREDRGSKRILMIVNDKDKH